MIEFGNGNWIAEDLISKIKVSSYEDMWYVTLYYREDKKGTEYIVVKTKEEALEMAGRFAHDMAIKGF